MNIRDKATMYRKLTAGDFGNTIPQFFSVAEWKACPDSHRYPLWGVRSATVSAHPACRLFVPAAEVEAYADAHFPGTPNISMMVDSVAGVLAMIHVAEIPGDGLVVDGILGPPAGANWRTMMSGDRRKQYYGVTARGILRHYLNANSLADLEILLEQYPDHVVEMSVLDRCIGSVPHRNAIIWECRKY